VTLDRMGGGLVCPAGRWKKKEKVGQSTQKTKIPSGKFENPCSVFRKVGEGQESRKQKITSSNYRGTRAVGESSMPFPSTKEREEEPSKATAPRATGGLGHDRVGEAGEGKLGHNSGGKETWSAIIPRKPRRPRAGKPKHAGLPKCCTSYRPKEGPKDS